MKEVGRIYNTHRSNYFSGGYQKGFIGPDGKKYIIRNSHRSNYYGDGYQQEIVADDSPERSEASPDLACILSGKELTPEMHAFWMTGIIMRFVAIALYLVSWFIVGVSETAGIVVAILSGVTHFIFDLSSYMGCRSLGYAPLNPFSSWFYRAGLWLLLRFGIYFGLLFI